MVSAELQTPIHDGYGYVLRPSDLEFLQISPEMLEACRTREYPLGMTSKMFQQFLESLAAALIDDAIYVVDVRLQGSSAHVFSSHHKHLPLTRTDVVAAFGALRNRAPLEFELDAIMARIGQAWPAESVRPTRRPFDSMHRL
jgi:hypothetical protein